MRRGTFERVFRARLAGRPSEGVGVGFEVFDKQTFGTTSFVPMEPHPGKPG